MIEAAVSYDIATIAQRIDDSNTPRLPFTKQWDAFRYLRIENGNASNGLQYNFPLATSDIVPIRIALRVSPVSHCIELRPIIVTSNGQTLVSVPKKSRELHSTMPQRILPLVLLVLLFLASLLFVNLVGFSSVARNIWTANQFAIEKGYNVTLARIPDKTILPKEPASASGSAADTSTYSSPSFSGLAIIGAFNHQRDVFKNTQEHVNATFEYIESWYKSLQNFPSMQGVVLHNMFSPEQTKAWMNHQIHFVEVNNRTSSFKQSSKRPINDMRFFVLREFLTRLYGNRDLDDPPEGVTLPDYVLFSDSYDVTFLRNPFEYMQQIDSLMGGPQLFVGEEYAYNVRKNIWDQWMNKSSTQCFGKSLPPSSRMINCGLVGGRIDVFLELMEQLIRKLKSAKPQKVCDQISLYYTLSNFYQDKFISGYPFNSQFNRWEHSNETLAYIAHK
jgi:hypothetical protein